MKLTYPDGKEVKYTYDRARQLVKVVDWAGRVTRYEYDGNGRLIKEVRPNGTQRSRHYNVAGQLVQQVEEDGQGELMSQVDYRYDAVGNIVEEQTLPKPESMSLPAVRMTYSAGNQLSTYQGQGVRFDGDGNLVWGPVKGSMGELKFDSRNRLVEAGGVRYRYDAENQRIGVDQSRYVVNSQPALSQVLVREEDGVRTFYVYGLGLIGEEKEGRYRSYHFDVRGSTVALTNEQGEAVGRFGYGPYGEVVAGEVTQTPFLFNGMFGVMTDEDGLYYMRARFYSPEIKRFVNMDVGVGNVVVGQSLNRFAFVSGRPVSLVDPFGFSEMQPELLNPTITEKQLGDLFNEIKKMDLVLNRLLSGCEARAYLISKTILASSYQPYQVWLINNRNKLTIKGKNYEWDFHTANMVKLPDGTRKVIDLIVSPDKPITVEEWKKFFSNIQHSSEEKFGIPPTICEGAQPCKHRKLTGSYMPNKEDSYFFPLEEQAKNTLACLKDIDAGSFLAPYQALFNQHCRARK